MRLFFARIMYTHVQTLFRIAYINFVKHFSFKRALFTFIMLLLHILGLLLLEVGRFLDEIFFYKYRNVEIKEPVFIISNPRSGTTHLHRLLCLDDRRYVYTCLYHTLFPCVTYIKIIQLVASLDESLGGWLKKGVEKLDALFFSGWKDIHPMGFAQSEEDEAFFTYMTYTPALVLLCPWAYQFKYLNFLDHSDEKTKEKIRAFYISSLKRFMYATNPNRQLLMKNVFSTGRLNFILECFPDAKIIYPVRHPYKAVPSLISMFTGPWRVHSPDIPDNSEECRAFGQLAIDYYAYFHQQKEKIQPENFKALKYDDLVAQPYETVEAIYAHFQIEMSDSFKEALKKRSKKSRSYTSKHTYSLAQYGISKNMISEQLTDLMEEFEFDKELEG